MGARPPRLERTLTAIAEPPSPDVKVVLEDGTTIPERRSTAVAPPLDDPRLDALVKELAQRTRGTVIEAFGEAWIADAFRKEVATARLAGVPLACVVVRINHVEQLDSLFGAGAAAGARAELARRFRLSVRQKDHVGEWGPGGIVMILPDTPYPGALCVADRLRGELERKPVALELAPGVRTVVPVAASFGAAAWGEAMDDPSELAEAASLAAAS
ncbi:MAG: two-component system, cell cycle response regulator [Gaiellaceae bacterium]|nr:two-component system, cell cycle response regulator [Gaiellaceae bacterium]